VNGCREATRDDHQARSLGLEVKEAKGFARVRIQMRHVLAACGARLQRFAGDASAWAAAVRAVLPVPRAPDHVSTLVVQSVAALSGNVASRARLMAS
jgi:hypothetical protein